MRYLDILTDTKIISRKQIGYWYETIPLGYIYNKNSILIIVQPEYIIE